MINEDNNPQVDLLDLESEHVRASTGKRFANYLIDLIIFYILAFLVGMLLAVLAPSVIDNLAEEEEGGFNIMERLISLVFYGLYMGIVEAAFNGKTIGKFITKTRSVNLDGTQISKQTAFARGLCKAVPFCAFSALGSPSNPWQDKWTNTMVIDERQLNIPSVE